MSSVEVFLQEVGIEAESTDELTQGEYQEGEEQRMKELQQHLQHLLRVKGKEIKSVMVLLQRGFLSDGRHTTQQLQIDWNYS